jgi:hypothetical protein
VELSLETRREVLWRSKNKKHGMRDERDPRKQTTTTTTSFIQKGDDAIVLLLDIDD